MPGGPWRAGGAAIALLTAIALEGTAYAQQPTEAPSAIVDVTIVGAGADAGPLVDTLRELLGRLGLTVNPHVEAAAGTGAPPSADRATVELDFTGQGDVVMNVRSDAAHPPVRRRIPREGSGSILREEVADAVRSAVESQLLSDPTHTAPAAPGPPVEASPPPPPPPPPPVQEAPAPAPPAREAPASPAHPADRWFAIDITTFTGAGPFAGNAGVVGRFGGGIALASRRGIHPTLTVTGQALLPFDTNASGVTAHSTVESLRVIQSIEAVRSYSWFALDVGLGLGFDVLDVEPSAYRTADAAPRTDPILCVAVVGNFALSPGVRLTLALMADVDPSSRQFLVDGGAAPGPILTPWPVRPTAVAGFEFTAFGEGLFASRDPR